MEIEQGLALILPTGSGIKIGTNEQRFYSHAPSVDAPSSINETSIACPFDEAAVTRSGVFVPGSLNNVGSGATV
jgi:hypothetical protein